MSDKPVGYLMDDPRGFDMIPVYRCPECGALNLEGPEHECRVA